LPNPAELKGKSELADAGSTSKNVKMKLSIMQMRLAILSIHDCEARDCIEVAKVNADQTGGPNVLDVYTFEIQGHPSASKCFSWRVQENPNRIMISAVLMTPNVRTASDAVKYDQNCSKLELDDCILRSGA
jgi:hypothetical protein